MAKCSRWILAIFIIQISAFAWAGSLVDVPIGHIGRVRYDPHGHNVLEGQHIAITDLICGKNKLDAFATLSFTTAKGMGQTGNSLLYGQGGQIVLRGSVRRDRDDRGQQGIFRGVLMQGTFLDAKLVDKGGKLTLIADFVEYLNPVVAAMLGLPVHSRGTLDLALSDYTSHGWVVDKVTGGSLNILSEPSSIATFGASLFGLFFTIGASVILRRKNTRIALER